MISYNELRALQAFQTTRTAAHTAPSEISRHLESCPISCLSSRDPVLSKEDALSESTSESTSENFLIL